MYLAAPGENFAEKIKEYQREFTANGEILSSCEGQLGLCRLIGFEKFLLTKHTKGNILRI